MRCFWEYGLGTLSSAIGFPENNDPGLDAGSGRFPLFSVAHYNSCVCFELDTPPLTPAGIIEVDVVSQTPASYPPLLNTGNLVLTAGIRGALKQQIISPSWIVDAIQLSLATGYIFY